MSARSGIRFSADKAWIITPEGEVLGLTSQDQPFFTAEIELNAADVAKTTYPRYVLLQ